MTHNVIRAVITGSMLISSLVIAGAVHAQELNVDGHFAQLVSVVPPTKSTFQPGEALTVRIQVRNSGTATWGSNVRLVGGLSQDIWTGGSPVYWGIDSCSTGVQSVAPGQDLTFCVVLTAPQTPGTTSFQWLLGLESGNTGTYAAFGPAIPSTPLVLTSGVSFKINSVTVDKVDALGHAAEDVRSFGLNFSSPAKDIDLLIRKKSPDEFFHTEHISEMSATTIYMSPGRWTKKLEPKTTYTYSVSANAATAVIGDQSDYYIGEFTTSDFAPAVQDNASYVGGTFPTKTTFKPGEQVKVKVTMKNTGTSAWDDRVKLYPLWVKSPSTWDTTQWGFGGGTIQPGRQATFEMQFGAPTTLTTTSIQWRLARYTNTSGTWVDQYFGDVTPSTPLQWTVVEMPFENKPPVIKGITAPTVLQVLEAGKWVVKAMDPEQKPLSYSVVWGDEVSTGLQPTSMVSPYYKEPQTATFQHYYAQAGEYAPQFTVTDSAGQSVSTSASVTVKSIEQPPVATGSMKITVVNGDIRCVRAPCGVLKNAKVSVYALVNNQQLGDFIGSSDTSGGTAVFYDIPATSYVAYASAPNFNEAKGLFAVYPGQGGYLTIKLYQSKETLICPPDCEDTIIDVFTPELPHGSLIQLVRTKGVYYLENGQKRPIRSRDVFNARGFDMSDVIVVDKTDFDRYPTGAELTATATTTTTATSGGLQEGSLAKALNDKAVYKIEGGKRRPFLSGSVFEAKGFYWSDIMVVTADMLNAYPLGDTISYSHLGDGFLIKSPRNPSVYWTQNGQKQHIANEAVFTAHAFRWQDIHVVSDDEIATYPTGPDMSR